MDIPSITNFLGRKSLRFTGIPTVASSESPDRTIDEKPIMKLEEIIEISDESTTVKVLPTIEIRDPRSVEDETLQREIGVGPMRAGRFFS